MLGAKERVFKSHPELSLEELVPQDNFYRQVQSKLDLDFVRELVVKYYTPFGRPSIDPVVFFKLRARTGSPKNMDFLHYAPVGV